LELTVNIAHPHNNRKAGNSEIPCRRELQLGIGFPVCLLALESDTGKPVVLPVKIETGIAASRV
jgi:hypothetical protein